MPDDLLLTIKEVAALLGISAGSLYNWRAMGFGPPDTGTHLTGGPGRPKILYSRADVVKWVNAGKCPHCGQALPLRMRASDAEEQHDA